MSDIEELSTRELSEINEENKVFINEYSEFCLKCDIQHCCCNNKTERPKFFGCNYYFHSIPIIIIIGDYLEISCECGRKEQLTFEEAYKKLLDDRKNLYIEDYYICRKEGHLEKKYEYYCFECKKNLCEFCLSYCNHNKKKLFIFAKEYRPTLKLIQEIKKMLETINIDKYLKILFENICNNFKSHPNHYSYFANIKAFYEDLLEKKKNGH